jgi:hypothetical protein
VSKIVIPVLVALVVLLIPEQAWAWGPATHLDFGLQVLDCLPLLTPAIARMLQRHSLDYLYGSVSADMVVGKNMAKEHDHCHNWKVALPLWDQARSDPERVMVLGFLSHLAADVVAHNYFVPSKTVESFPTRTTGHTYWEVRFDQLSHQNPAVWAALHEVGQRRFTSHDRFLAHHLRRASKLFSIGTSRRIYNSVLALTRMERWRHGTAAMARRSPWPLDPVEVGEYRRMSVGFILTTLNKMGRARSLQADPIGARNLKAARGMKRDLQRLGRRSQLQADSWVPFLQLVRDGFREAIYEPLQLPPVSMVTQRPPSA